MLVGVQRPHQHMPQSKLFNVPRTSYADQD